MRGSCLFVLVLCCAVVNARHVAQQSLDAPTQVHINFGNSDGRSMTVSWLTKSELEGMVNIGKTTQPTRMVPQQGNAFRYHYKSDNGEDYTSGLIHHVTVNNLEFDTWYFYSCGTNTSGFSQVFSFKTPPPVSAKSAISINLIGDLGQTKNSSSTLDHIKEDVGEVHMTLLIGDLSYADSASTYAANCTQRRWDSWGELVQPVFANQPLMVLPGNHEIEQSSKPGTTPTPFLAYNSRFKMPSVASGATHDSLYYSFNSGPAHIVMLNSYMDFDSSSDQYKWLVNDLKKVDRSLTPWLICNMHAPWYNSDTYHHNEPEEMGMRASMEHLFKQYDVDLVFSGHVHAYERMYPVYNNVTTPGATTYINIGDGGNREGPADGYFPQPSWSAYREPAFGHGRLDLVNATHAHFTWHKNLNSEPTVSDDVWLIHNSARKETHLNTGVFHVAARQLDGFAPSHQF
eukprot:m.38047 g.38047  ORF g.38047 m.38047 type:complete len:458 (-) comp10154_c0_seq1:5283-6656(-)